MSLSEGFLIFTITLSIWMILVMLVNAKKDTPTKYFTLTLVFNCLWIFVYFLILMTNQIHLVRFTTPLILLFANSGAKFSLTFIKKYTPRYQFIVIDILTYSLVLLSIFPNAYLKNPYLCGINICSENGFAANIFLLAMVIILIIVFKGIIEKIHKLSNRERKIYCLIIGGLVLYSILMLVTEDIFPLFGIREFMGLGFYFSLTFLLPSLTAIIKFQALNLKLLLIEWISYSIILLSVFRLIFEDNMMELLINIIVSIISILGAIIIILQAKKSEKQKIELETIDKRKSDFLADIAHRLKTPLTIARTSIDISADEAKKYQDKTLNRFLSSATLAIDRLNRMSSNLIITGKINFGITKLEKKEFDLSELIKTNCQNFSILMGQRKLRIQVQPKIKISGDAARLQETFLNLLDNALKFTDPETGKIEVQLREKDNQIALTVSDNGKGIEPDHLPHIFDRFYQAHAGSKSGSAGIGLSVAKWVVEGHGGKIGVTSLPNQKTDFTIILPNQSK